jgi:signal transduction histidine kinase
MSDFNEDLRRVLDALPIGIVLHRDRLVLYANRVCRDRIGLGRLDPLFGREPIGSTAPSERAIGLQPVGAAECGETGQSVWPQLTGEDGRSYAVAMLRARVEFAAAPAALTVLHDVTEYVDLQQQVQRAQKLESVWRFATGIVHDFNNLLAVIFSCAADLESRIRSGSLPETEIIDALRGAGERARDLTAQLLALARTDAAAPPSLDLNAVVLRSEKLLRRVLRRDIRLVTTLDPALWRVRADAGIVERVLLNLVVNSQDAMPDGGRLTIETANGGGDDRGAAAGSHVRLTVHDTGHGMSPYVKEHLFEPFFTTKPIGQGTGLGLAIVHGIVTRSGGYVVVDSAPGQGTTFDIYLPRTGE